MGPLSYAKLDLLAKTPLRAERKIIAIKANGA
jgi:hypothetical protein